MRPLKPVLTAALLALGLAGWLNRATAWALIIASLMPIFVGLLRRTREDITAEIVGWARQPANLSWLWMAAVPFLVIATVGAMVPPGKMNTCLT